MLTHCSQFVNSFTRIYINVYTLFLFGPRCGFVSIRPLSKEFDCKILDFLPTTYYYIG